MLNGLLDFSTKENSVTRFNNAVRQGVPLAVFGVTSSFKHFLTSNLSGNVLYITKDILSARNAATAISRLTGEEVNLICAKDESLISFKAFSKDTLYSRIVSSQRAKDFRINVATIESIIEPFSKDYKCLVLEKGKDYNLEELVFNLTSFGYTQTSPVGSAGFFSVRGDVIDVFPINSQSKIRLDFFGDNLESIREIDVETGKTIVQRTSVKILSALEFSFTNNDKIVTISALKKELNLATSKNRANLSVLQNEVLSNLELNNISSLDSVYPLFESFGNFTDIINKDTTIVFDETKAIYDTFKLLSKEFTDRYLSLYNDGGVFSFAKNKLLSEQELISLLSNYKLVSMQAISSVNGFFMPLQTINPVVSGVADYRGKTNELVSDVKNWLSGGYRVVIFAGEISKAEKVYFDLKNAGIKSEINYNASNCRVNIIDKNIEQGFVFHEEKIAVIGRNNVFSRVGENKRVKSKKQIFFSAPANGDIAVHEIHGIGKVLGNKKISTTEGVKDYIAVQYAGGDVLYVPVEQMDILTRYLGSEKNPRLSKIGGDFKSSLQKIRNSIKKMSFDLKKLYHERNEMTGYKFKMDEELMSIFLSAFRYEDTEDQAKATQDVFKDMTDGKVMDRLICGDVGFGKTEVAFRGVFLACLNGRQSAMLAPTTILTEQHFASAIERFKEFGIKVAVINRFKTPKQQKEILEKLKNGEIDFIIGTHRLLGKDVQFKDLGFLVLDEEQRFGVEHKEKIKLLRKNVCTLTLSATPIPRTLHMSLSGIRPISTINTPPKSRLPVQTYVAEESDVLIKDAIVKEINRGGQVFILYNRVETIFTFAQRIKELIKEENVMVVHGQMEERVLERNVADFYQGKSNVLISTTIIENGIDLPRANTIIVIDADKLGLSTLYQLKGRVGRSDRLAYAYFTYKREKVLTETAYERLNAIIEFTEMGSGIKIAMRDLEIRGAGNILGAEQHGHMDKVGYELYSKLLKSQLFGEEDRQVDLDVRVSAYIPEDYIEVNSQRLDTYKQIAEINSFESEEETKQELEQLYGKLPLEVMNLIEISSVKRLAKSFGISKVIVTKERVELVFSSINKLSEEYLARTIDAFKGHLYISVAGEVKINFIRQNEDNEKMLYKVKKFLKNAYALKKQNKNLKTAIDFQ